MAKAVPDSTNTDRLLRQIEAGDQQEFDELFATHRSYLRQGHFKLLTSGSSDMYPRRCVGLITNRCAALFRNVKVTDPSVKVLLEGVQATIC